MITSKDGKDCKPNVSTGVAAEWMNLTNKYSVSRNKQQDRNLTSPDVKAPGGLRQEGHRAQLHIAISDRDLISHSNKNSTHELPSHRT